MGEPEPGAEELEGGRRKNFVCGVVEGFYGRPWTTEQRKDLFQKLKKWGMDTYVYAPKDDYKHRAYWRELYTVEEAEHLTSLIAAARSQGIVFCYALSPGLDITYSSHKEITQLKRKLEQVSQFGCTSFALLFDDIDTEMSEADKQIFQSFAHAQVSVTNEMHQHLGRPQFLLCPTQYCATRAAPDVNNSEYLNTLGSKLSQEINIMWTGQKVISKTLTAESLEEITQVLRRPPVIWDNLHANDYDQKRVFLGPYCGRSPELIPLLRGVLTNPNCEYNANHIPIWTLAHWANCSSDAPALESVSWDIKLERESELGVCDDEVSLPLSKHVYHHRQALRRAIDEWLPEFSIPRDTAGTIPEPPPVTAPVPIIPIMPSVNTCMSLITPTCNTSTTSTVNMSTIPTVNTSQLQALAEVCTARAEQPLLSTGVQMETFNPVSNPIMNSLVSPTKVVTNDSIPNPIIPLANMSIPAELPISTLPVPIMGIKNLDTENNAKNDGDDKLNGDHNRTIQSTSVLEGDSFIEELKKGESQELEIVVDDVESLNQEVTVRNGSMSIGAESPQAMSPGAASMPEVGTSRLDVSDSVGQDLDVIMTDGCSENGSMQVEPSSSPVGSDMMVEPADCAEPTDDGPPEPLADPNALTTEDLVLLCDLFYLPFEHGSRGLRLLHDFHWLVMHAASTLPRSEKDAKPEVCEWRRRRCRFAWWCSRTRRLARRLSFIPNRQLHRELQPYVWDLCAVVALLDGFVRWLELGKFPPNIATYSQGSYTWFSKGWREAFECGSQEPWVFRGGLTADLRRLLPIECGNAEILRTPTMISVPLSVRPYRFMDDESVCRICHETCRDGSDCTELFPPHLQTLPADRLVAPFLTLTPEFCMVIEDDCDIDDDFSGSQEKLNGETKPELVGYACAALNSKEFYRKQEVSWIPEMCQKYPKELLQNDNLSQAAKDCVRHFHNFSYSVPEIVFSPHPALLSCCVLPTCRDPQAPARLLTCCLAALKANGATGVHVCINTTDMFLHQFYTKLGFVELHQDTNNRTYLGRTF